MSRITHYLFALSILCVSLFSSCEKSDEEPDQDTDTNYYFRCKIDDVVWEADFPRGANPTIVSVLGPLEYFVIDNNTTATFNQLNVSFLDLGDGVYGFSDATYFRFADFEFIGFVADPNNPLDYTLEVDEVNRILKGTFSFEMIEEMTFENEVPERIFVTEGEFRVSY